MPESDRRRTPSGPRPSRDEGSRRKDSRPNSRRPDARGGAPGPRPFREDGPRRQAPSRRPAASRPAPPRPEPARERPDPNAPVRLNRAIANAGICSRRDADLLITSGRVQVNGRVVTELGTKVSKTDRLKVDEREISAEPPVYILLNKGRDTISTTQDERGRVTVMDAIEEATGYRVYPVGRLDRNTTGLILLTNDGDLAHRLMHPSHKVTKTYEVMTDVPLPDQALQQFRLGVMLEDGIAKAKSVKRSPQDPRVVTLSVQEGRNHLIRRMIGAVGSEVQRLRRTIYGGLTDRDLRVGRWRHLQKDEIEALRRLVGLDVIAPKAPHPSKAARQGFPDSASTQKRRSFSKQGGRAGQAKPLKRKRSSDAPPVSPKEPKPPRP